MENEANSNPNELTTTFVNSLLEEIRSELKVIGEKQEQKVSPEFNALMDGYVSKANESESLKAKYTHVESHYEELKLELKNQKSLYRQVAADMDATREALKLSELDVSKYKRDLEQSKFDFEQKIAELIDQRDALGEKVKELTAWKEQNDFTSNELKSEILEHKHKIKQLEQERQIEKETTSRKLRESERLVQELKQQLDLREREASYKNALLEQLIKQTSLGQGLSINDPASLAKAFPQAGIDPNMAAPLASSPAAASSSSDFGQIDPGDDNAGGDKKFSWGAFRK